MPTLGFIGTGTIGAPMAGRLLEAGHSVVLFDVNATATAALAARGAQLAPSVAALAARCPTVFLSLPGPTQIETVVLGADGLLAAGGALHTIVDLSTNSVQLSRQIAEAAQAHRVHYLDAPVSGGKRAAAEGKLAVMVGGDRATFEAVRPLLEHLGEQLFYMGPSGCGTLTKLVNNQIFLAASVLVQEGFVMGAKAGLEPAALLEVLEASSAGPLLARAPLFLSRRFDLGVFALGIAAKDIALALDSAAAVGAAMPLTTAAHGIYQQALARDLGGEDFFATLKLLEAEAGMTLAPLGRPKAS